MKNETKLYMKIETKNFYDISYNFIFFIINIISSSSFSTNSKYYYFFRQFTSINVQILYNNQKFLLTNEIDENLKMI